MESYRLSSVLHSRAVTYSKFDKDRSSVDDLKKSEEEMDAYDKRRLKRSEAHKKKRDIMKSNLKKTDKELPEADKNNELLNKYELQRLKELKANEKKRQKLLEEKTKKNE